MKYDYLYDKEIIIQFIQEAFKERPRPEGIVFDPLEAPTDSEFFSRDRSEIPPGSFVEGFYMVKNYDSKWFAYYSPLFLVDAIRSQDMDLNRDIIDELSPFNDCLFLSRLVDEGYSKVAQGFSEALINYPHRELFYHEVEGFSDIEKQAYAAYLWYARENTNFWPQNRLRIQIQCDVALTDYWMEYLMAYTERFESEDDRK